MITQFSIRVTLLMSHHSHNTAISINILENIVQEVQTKHTTPVQVLKILDSVAKELFEFDHTGHYDAEAVVERLRMVMK